MMLLVTLTFILLLSPRIQEKVAGEEVVVRKQADEVRLSTSVAQ